MLNANVNMPVNSNVSIIAGTIFPFINSILPSPFHLRLYHPGQFIVYGENLFPTVA
jgi:hypothetical protein